MNPTDPTPALPSRRQQWRMQSLSTIAFAVCFAVWTIFSIIGLQIKQALGLSETQFGVLVATPILTGSLSRLLLGIWAEQYGGRLVYTVLMGVTAAAVWLLSLAQSYPMFLLAALGVGLAGGSFVVGVTYISRWYESERQGAALGVFGIGNLGAAVTNFGAPFLLLAFGWVGTVRIYAAALLAMAVIFHLSTDEDPHTAARKARREKPKSALMQLTPLRKLQVWRFSLYYFFVFGAFVALALWLPRYYIGVYHLDVKTAGLLAAAYSLPGSVFRALGGWLSDRYGARLVMYWTFIASVVICFILSYPSTDYTIHGIRGPIHFNITIGLELFVALTFILGFFMSLGKAAVYKHIPVYYADNIGSVGGLVGMLGGLGGFILPICFGLMNDWTGVWTSCFMLLFALVAVAFLWMHISIRVMERKALPQQLSALPQLPEMREIHAPHHQLGGRFGGGGATI